MTAYGRTAIVRYRGTLSDGSVFDSTEGRAFWNLQLVGFVIHGSTRWYGDAGRDGARNELSERGVSWRTTRRVDRAQPHVRPH